ncbi:MAG: NifX-associated nitrogen fixation protein, partial [Bryobacterales bacterium]|nr:NifX-associated nitrogen fixation protein [Bryobacterales bacterium]
MTLAEPTTAVDPMTSPFMKVLVALQRAEDAYGVWEGKSDAELLRDFIVTKEQRRAAAAQCGADPDLVWRVEQFYGAIGLMIEQETGLVASPMLKIYDEGFGRVILMTGKLVVLTKHLRDA